MYYIIIIIIIIIKLLLLLLVLLLLVLLLVLLFAGGWSGLHQEVYWRQGITTSQAEDRMGTERQSEKTKA